MPTPTPQNQAAWLSAKCCTPLEVRKAPYTSPGPGEIVVKNAALAINPVDGGKQALGDIMLSYIKYPFILGCDVAGDVVEVGRGVERFKVGDRVIGHAIAGAQVSNKASEGAFQHYTVIRQHLAAVIPATIPFDKACVLPLALTTSAYGLFHADCLNLPAPQVPASPPTGEAVIITGGASSVGSSAIQLAKSAGYEIYTTASPKNFDYVKQLGASHVYDYHSSSLVADMVAGLRGEKVAGAYAIGNGSVETCMQVLRQSQGSKLVVYASIPLPESFPTSTLGTAQFVGRAVFWMGSTNIKSKLKGVQAKFVDCKHFWHTDGAVSRIYQQFLPQALERGQFVPAPEPMVVGTGLEKVQEAMEIQKKGVSARKVVVLL
ncbi:putative secondary metabolism biosynthetic enzyme [Diaporthe australafricana]|uniref:Secondary metabolism biosynthetic enzyme n=1 Tax=Diaporthe australafricana TaxID=127596 RepID=A0ABR3XZY4_9PEZI